MCAPVLIVRIDGDFARENPEAVEALCERIDASDLGEVSGTMNLGGLERLLWIDARAENEEMAEVLIRPRLQRLVAQMGLASVASVEVPLDDDAGEDWNDDDEDWNDDDEDWNDEGDDDQDWSGGDDEDSGGDDDDE